MERLGINHLIPSDATHGPVASMAIGQTVTGIVETLVDARANLSTLKLVIEPTEAPFPPGLILRATAEVPS